MKHICQRGSPVLKQTSKQTLGLCARFCKSRNCGDGSWNSVREWISRPVVRCLQLQRSEADKYFATLHVMPVIHNYCFE